MATRFVSAKARHLVAQRAHNCCEYCYSQLGYSPDPFNVEHIFPKTLGGNTQLDNLAFACFGCNRAKSFHIQASDPLTKLLVSLYHPRQDRWNDHFQWNSSFTEIIGLTPTGRATVHLLKLNRLGVVNLRHVLHQIGEHPPKPIDD